MFRLESGIIMDGPLELSGDQGSPGEVVISNGTGNPVSWGPAVPSAVKAGVEAVRTGSDINTLTAGSPVVFDTVVVDPNSNYNNTTGIFTVPYDGMYSVTGCVIIMNSLGTDFAHRTQIYVNGTALSAQSSTFPSGTEYGNSVAMNLDLSAGDQVYIALNENISGGLVVIRADPSTRFSIWYLDGYGSGGGGGGGTVTSVGITTTPTEITVSGSPVTTAGTIGLALAATGVTAGTYSYAHITVDSTGRLTSASSGTPPAGTVTSIDVEGTTGNIVVSGTTVTTSGTFTIDLDTVGVTTGTYTLATIEVDAYGRVIAASSGTAGAGSVTSVDVVGTTGNISAVGGPVTTTGTITVDLVTTAVTAGTYSYAHITVDAYGRLTAAASGTPPAGTVTSVQVAGATGELVSSGGPITSSGTITMGLATSGVTAGTYTLATVEVDAFGRVIDISSGTAGSGSVTSVDVVGTTGNISAVGGPVTTTGTITVDLVTTAVTAGTYSYAHITVDAYGRLTAAASGSPPAGTVTSVQVAGTTGQISSTGGPITSSGTITMALVTTGVTSGSYTNTDLTVDEFGRITAASNGSGGGGTPGGSTGSVQWNNGGVFAGDSNFTYNGFTATINVSTASTRGFQAVGSGSFADWLYWGQSSATAAQSIMFGDAGIDGFWYVFGNNGTTSGYIGTDWATNAVDLVSTGVLRFHTNSTLKGTLDTAGNFGLGVTPSAWGSSLFRAVELGTTGDAYYSFVGSNGIGNSTNLYHNGSNWVYANNGAGARLQQGTTSFEYVIHGSGSAGGNAGFGTTVLGVYEGRPLILQGGTAGATGTGINFPATQNPSSNANTLDDYEEGTWTPIDASGAGLSITDATGRYIKIGKLVHFQLELGAYPVTVNGANAGVTLPFASAANPPDSPAAMGYYSTAGGISLSARVAWNSNMLSFVRPNVGFATNADMSGASFIQVAGTYEAAT